MEEQMSKGKFKAMVHYIVHECQDDPKQLGSVRLNKALWFTDLISYQMNGSSITGEKYVKRMRGPVPKTILATLEELQKERKILIQEPEYQFDSRRYILLSKPDDDILNEDEKNLVKSVIDFVCRHKASEISEITHDEVWDVAKEGEEIPLFATLAAGQGAITKQMTEWAESILQSRMIA